MQGVNPRDLQLSRDYQSSTDLCVEAPDSPHKVKCTKVPDWLLGGRALEVVKTDTIWQHLLSNTEDLDNAFWLESRVGICLEAFAATVPSCTDKGPPSVPQEELKRVVEGRAMDPSSLCL